MKDYMPEELARINAAFIQMAESKEFQEKLGKLGLAYVNARLKDWGRK